MELFLVGVPTQIKHPSVFCTNIFRSLFARKNFFETLTSKSSSNPDSKNGIFFSLIHFIFSLSISKILISCFMDAKQIAVVNPT